MTCHSTEDREDYHEWSASTGGSKISEHKSKDIFPRPPMWRLANFRSTCKACPGSNSCAKPGNRNDELKNTSYEAISCHTRPSVRLQRSERLHDQADLHTQYSMESRRSSALMVYLRAFPSCPGGRARSLPFPSSTYGLISFSVFYVLNSFSKADVRGRYRKKCFY